MILTRSLDDETHLISAARKTVTVSFVELQAYNESQRAKGRSRGSVVDGVKVPVTDTADRLRSANTNALCPIAKAETKTEFVRWARDHSMMFKTSLRDDFYAFQMMVSNGPAVGPSIVKTGARSLLGAAPRALRTYIQPHCS